MSGFLGINTDNGERPSLLPVQAVKPSPDTLTKLIKRLRVLTLTLLPVEVDPAVINEPTSMVITSQVISAYRAAAGDFVDALPYCLLCARARFMKDANNNPADFGENLGRAIACEVLARRIVHQSSHDLLASIMSTRFRHREADGGESDLSSALERAIDSNCIIFLSSTEAQEVVNALWNGDLIQNNNADDEIDYVPYAETREHTFWGHLDASRLSVPKYQNAFRIIIWFFFLFVYSQAVREPLERLGDDHVLFDFWEIVLYIMGLSFVMEDLHRVYTLLRFVTLRAFTFWNIISLITDALLTAAFVLRLLGLNASGDETSATRLKSFQVLSFVAPFIWMKLITVFDRYKYIGTMQICVARMLKESGIFFALLSVLAIGFAQALYALDAADGHTDPPSTVINVLIQALLQSPNYEKYGASPANLILYYFWNMVTAIILLNVLISLFSSAYSDVVEDAEAQYLAFFASKTISMIRAPDSYVYPAPFNLIEAVFIAPLEYFSRFRLSSKTYAQVNRYIMATMFFIPLAMIALYEASFHTENIWTKNWLQGMDAIEDDSAQIRDPDVPDNECNGMKISKVPYAELIKVFPDTQQSSDATILKEIGELKHRMANLLTKLQERAS